ncbi:MAG: hypothetical protein JWM85_2701, partial [Acidimicrobiaceae bacterium]|nr:hypothetical protein [Acidimicrobiaceae bacterium]
MLTQDALLYFAAAIFAAGTARKANLADYRAWGEMAAIAYVVGGLICAAVALRVRRQSR